MRCIIRCTILTLLVSRLTREQCYNGLQFSHESHLSSFTIHETSQNLEMFVCFFFSKEAANSNKFLSEVNIERENPLAKSVIVGDVERFFPIIVKPTLCDLTEHVDGNRIQSFIHVSF